MIDIPTHLLFDHKSSPVTFCGTRKLKLMDSSVAKIYQRHLVKACHAEDIFNKMNNLCQRRDLPFPTNMTEEYEELDIEIENFYR